MLAAVIKLTKKAVSNIATGVIAVASLVLQIVLGVSPILIVLSAAAFGIIMYFATRNKSGESDSGKEEGKT